MLLRSLLILLCGLGLCVPALAESAKVLTTIKPLQQIAAAVMDGVDTPAVLLPPGNSPHNYALRPSDRRALLDAERIYWVGPELELFLKDVLDRQGNAQALLHLPGMRVREQLQSINFQTEEGDHGHSHDHGHDHDHGALDSHIWLSPDNAQQIAGFMAEDLASLYPQHAEKLAANAELFAKRLTALDARLKDRLEPLQDRAYSFFMMATAILRITTACVPAVFSACPTKSSPERGISTCCASSCRRPAPAAYSPNPNSLRA